MTKPSSMRSTLDVAFEPAGSCITDAELQAELKRFDLQLPDEYVAFLLHVNGGVPERASFSFGAGDDANASIVGILYGVRVGREAFDLLHYNIPPRVRQTGLLLIGQDVGGNDLAMRVQKGFGHGEICFIDHEIEEHAVQPIRVAASFAVQHA